MDCVLDGSLLHIPFAAAGSHPATYLLCYPAGSWYDHGEDIMLISCVTNDIMEQWKTFSEEMFFRKIKEHKFFKMTKWKSLFLIFDLHSKTIQISISVRQHAFRESSIFMVYAVFQKSSTVVSKFLHFIRQQPE